MSEFPHCDTCDSGGIAATDCPNCGPRVMAWKDAEIERLRATVDRLPKTADGVPVTPGMECWYRSCGGRVVSFQISDWGDIATDWDDSGPRYYSTRAAAREAAGGDE